MTPPAAATIAVRSDDAQLTAWIAALIAAAPELRMVPPSGGAGLVVVDERLEGVAEAIRHAIGAGARCAVLTDGSSPHRLLATLASGADGCVVREADAAAMRGNLVAAARGTFQLPRGAWPQVVELARAAAADTDDPGVPLIAAPLIREVIAQRRFTLVFQPIVDLRSGSVTALESLARFTAEPAQPPNVWLAAAHDAGLRVALEHELLRAALGALDGVPAGIALSVNLSPEAATDPGLAAVLADAPVQRLILEITDHHQLDDYEALSEALADPRARGMRIAVDDSGQGISSLQQIAQLRPSLMKLNRTLTRDIDRDATKRSLAHALSTFAAQLGAAIVAEGLETVGELHTLRAVGAPLGQGYLLARPRPLAELELGRALALPAGGEGSAAAPAGPALELRGAAREDFREATRAALRFLSDKVPAATFVVAHLDYVQRRHTVIGARGPLAELLEPGAATALEDTMCFHMAAGDGPRACPNLAEDPAYAALPLARALDAGAYVGLPLELPGGARVGSVFAVSRGPGALGLDELPLVGAVTAVLAEVLVRQTDGMDRGSVLRFLRELARTDPLTGVLNRPGLSETLEAEVRRSAERRTGSYVAVEVEGLDSLRGHYGHAVGDLVLKDVAAALAASVEHGDVVGRVGDSRFAVLLPCRHHDVGVRRLRHRLGPRLAEAGVRRELTLELRLGAVALCDLGVDDDAWARAAEHAGPLGEPPAAQTPAGTSSASA